MSDKLPTAEEQARPDYVAPLELGAQQANVDLPAAHTATDGQLVREEANPLPGPDSVTGPYDDKKEFTVAGALHPDEWMTGEGSARYDGDGQGFGSKPQSAQASVAPEKVDSTSPERKVRAADKS